jgi:hypothetical protein
LGNRKQGNYDLFAILSYGLKDWNAGALQDAGVMFEAFDESNAAPPNDWINTYKPLIQAYILDFKNFRRLATRAESVTPDTAPALREEIASARLEAATGSRIDEAYGLLLEKLDPKP